MVSYCGRADHTDGRCLQMDYEDQKMKHFCLQKGAPVRWKEMSKMPSVLNAAEVCAWPHVWVMSGVSPRANTRVRLGLNAELLSWHRSRVVSHHKPWARVCFYLHSKFKQKELWYSSLLQIFTLAPLGNTSKLSKESEVEFFSPEVWTEHHVLLYQKHLKFHLKKRNDCIRKMGIWMNFLFLIYFWALAFKPRMNVRQ